VKSQLTLTPGISVQPNRIYLRRFSSRFLHFVIGTSIGVICEKFTRHESLSLFPSDSRTVARSIIGILYRFIGMFKRVTLPSFFFNFCQNVLIAEINRNWIDKSELIITSLVKWWIVIWRSCLVSRVIASVFDDRSNRNFGSPYRRDRSERKTDARISFRSKKKKWKRRDETVVVISQKSVIYVFRLKEIFDICLIPPFVTSAIGALKRKSPMQIVPRKCGDSTDT
jgi:hypothetical protein